MLKILNNIVNYVQVSRSGHCVANVNKCDNSEKKTRCWQRQINFRFFKRTAKLYKEILFWRWNHKLCKYWVKTDGWMLDQVDQTRQPLFNVDVPNNNELQ